MKPEQPDYFSYLLRLWRVNGNGGTRQTVWRASLENPHTGQRQGFANLDDLFGFLQAQTGVTLKDASSQRGRPWRGQPKGDEPDSFQAIEKQKEIKR